MIFKLTNASVFVITLLLFSKTHAQNKGFIDFNGYYDTREFSTLTINMLGKLPHRFQYFSLTNYQGAQESSDLASFYSEQNVRWAITSHSPIDLTMQYVMRNGDANDDIRLGFRWRIHSTPILDSICQKINFKYSINPLVVQFREGTETKLMTLIEHVYRFNIFPRILNNRVYLGGFADHNLSRNEDNKVQHNWVTEHQLGFKLIDQLYLIAEFRINTFLAKENKTGLGYGLEYKIKF